MGKLYVNNIYPTTGSWIDLNGDVHVSGDMAITGSLRADTTEFIVTSDSTQITGSLHVSGSGITLTAGEAANAVLTLNADQGDDAADITTITHAAGGDVTVASGGDIVLDPAGLNVKPGSDDSDILGTQGTAWKGLYLAQGTGRGCFLDADGDTSIRGAADDVITLQAGGVDYLTLKAGGENGPELQLTGSLYITGSAATSAVLELRAAEAAAAVLYMYADQGDDSSADLFAITTYPSSTGNGTILHANGTDLITLRSSGMQLTGSLQVSGSGITLTAGEAASAVLTLNADQSDAAASITTLTTLGDGTGKFTIASGGDIVLDPAGLNVLPGGDSTDYLGSAGVAWKGLYVDDIDLNGQGRIDLDEDADTSIRSSSDNVIKIEVGGSDVVTINASSLSTTNSISGSGNLEIVGTINSTGNIATTGSVTAASLVGAVTGAATGLSGTPNIACGTISGTTIDATTDFTIGTTVITDDSIVMTPTTGDTVTIAASTNGALTITTVDTAATAANIIITADGTVDIDSAGLMTLDSGGNIALEPAAGSHIKLDDVIQVDSGVITGATSVTSTAFLGALDGVVGGNTPAAAEFTNVSGSGTLQIVGAINSTGNIATTGSVTAGGFVATANVDFGAYEVRAQTFESDVSTGTAPLVIASTTNVANLNASSLGGATFAAPGAIGGTTPAAAEFTNVSGSGNLEIVGTINSTGNIATSGSIDVDGTANLDNTDIDGTFTMDGTTFDVNATAAVTIDGTTVSIDGTDDVNLTVTSSTGAEDLTIQQIGANDSSIIITAAGTGTDAISIDATAGDMLIAPSLINGKTLKIGPNGATEMVFTPHGTAASEKISITNTAGTADDAIKIVATAGGVTVQAGNDSLHIDADGTDADALNIDSAGGVDLDAAGTVAIDSSAGSVTVGAILADGQTLKLGKNGAVETIIAPHGTAGSELYSVINTAGTTDGTDADGAILLSAVAGGIGLAWADGKDLWAEGGRAVVTANEDAADCIKLHADAGTSQTITVLNDAGTSAAAIGLAATAGGITLSSSATTAQDAVTVSATQTTKNGLTLTANALTSGDAVSVSSTSTSSTARSLLKLANSHASATGTSVIEISQVSTGPLINAAYGSVGSNIALKVIEATGTVAGGGATTTTASNAVPANAVIIAVAVRVTTTFNNGHITKIGVTGDDDFLVSADTTGGSAANVLKDGVLEQANDTAIFPWQPANNSFLTLDSASDLVFTHTSCTAGVVRTAVYYYEITAPTS